MSGKVLTERDRREWNLNQDDPCDKDVWRSSVRSDMHAASQLPGREPYVRTASFSYKYPHSMF